MIPSEAPEAPSRLPVARGRSERTLIFFGDGAENSIMQTISIAVSAILIMAGLITAPALINNARDTNAKQDLANIGIAQEYRLSDFGAYTSSLGNLITTSGTTMTTSLSSSEIGIISGSSPNCYAVFGKSKSGKTVYRSSGSSSSSIVPTPWPLTAPVSYPPSSCLYWPRSAQEATSNIIPPLNDWVLANGATLDPVTQILTLPNYASAAESPKFKVDSISDFTYTAEGKIPALVDTIHNNVLVGVAYYGADGVTPVTNAGGYTSNGDGLQITQANVWTRVTSGLGTPGGWTEPTLGIKYMAITLWNNASYS